MLYQIAMIFNQPSQHFIRIQNCHQTEKDQIKWHILGIYIGSGLPFLVCCTANKNDRLPASLFFRICLKALAIKIKYRCQYNIIDRQN